MTIRHALLEGRKVLEHGAISGNPEKIRPSKTPGSAANRQDSANNFDPAEYNRIRNPYFEASLLLAHTLDTGIEKVLASGPDNLTADDLDRYRGFLRRRRSGTPVAYITGYKEFRGTRFRVNPSVLIPRPDTEALVEVAIGLYRVIAPVVAVHCQVSEILGKSGLHVAEGPAPPPATDNRPIPNLPKKDPAPEMETAPSAAGGLSAETAAETSETSETSTPQNFRPAPGRAPDAGPIHILDLCTGSGCIAVSLKKEIPEAEVFMSDIDENALACARENARDILGKGIPACQSDLFENIQDTFHLIVSNPPYVEETYAPEMLGHPEQNRETEPPTALFSGTDGLDTIRRIVSNAMDYLEPGGYLLLEAAIWQAEEIWKMMDRHGYIYCLIAGGEENGARFIFGRKP